MKERNLLSVAAFIGQAADLATIAKGVMPDVRQIQKALPPQVFIGRPSRVKC